MRLAKYIEKAFWALLLGAVSLGVSCLTDISNSVSMLNERMAVIIERVAWHETALRAQDARILRLETQE